ncbi:hypothetical protein HDU86_003872 [Geranomyces michiganensis]|nr:hypothetical protein HDU86_003872 [Geranomyces michiganensis]
MRELPKSLSYSKDTQTINTAGAHLGKASFNPPLPAQLPRFTTTATATTTTATAQKRLASAGSSDDLDRATSGPVHKRVASLEELEHLNNASGAYQQQQHRQQQQERLSQEQREVVMTDADALRISTAGGADESNEEFPQLGQPSATPTTRGIANALAGLKLVPRGGAGGGGVDRCNSINASGSAGAVATPPLELGLGTPRSGSPAVAAPTLGELIECGVATVTPAALLSALRAQQRVDENRMDVLDEAEEEENQNASPFSTDARILPVDLRYVADFARRRIVGSANVNLPMLMLKRFRRGAVSSFQISNFLTGAASKELFDEWLEGDGKSDVERVIVVYDDEMDENATDTEAWAMVTILAKELADDVYTPSGRRSPPGSSSLRDTTPTAAPIPARRPLTRVAYLRGGFHAFEQTQGAGEFMEQEPNDAIERAEAADSMQLPELAVKQLPEGGNRDPGTPLAVQAVPGAAGNGLQIRTSQLKTDPAAGTGSGSPTTAAPPTGEAGTPTIGRLIAGAGAGTGQRKKSAFSINTTKLVPQSRARGNTLNAGLQSIGPPRRLTMHAPGGGGGGAVSAGISGALPRRDLMARDSGAGNGPTTAYPSNGPKPQLPDVREKPGMIVAAPHLAAAVPQTPIGTARPELPQQSSVNSDPHQHHQQPLSGTAQQQQQPGPHNIPPVSPDSLQQQQQQQHQFFQQLSPGPSTLPTPVEPVSVILPHLLLGSDALPQAKDAVEQLQELGVTHVLNMAVEVENKLVDESGKFDVKWCLAEDHAEHDIEPAIREAVDWIAEAHAASPSNIVFVHCKAGRSRSATTVIAYLVVHHGMRLRDAYETVKQARPGVSPNLGFMLALLRIEKEVHGEDAHHDKGVYP